MFDGPALPAPELPCGTYRLDLARRALRDEAGKVVPLRPKSFDLLQLLLRNAGRALSRAELLDALWGDIHVTDDSLTQCVVDVRRGLRGAAGVELRTLPRRGYVLELPGAATPRPRALLSVLPFAGEGPARPVAAGLSEAVLVALAGQPGLGVVRGGRRAAGSDWVLEGSLRQAGHRLRVTARLVEAASDRLLWAEHHDWQAEGPEALDLEDALASRIAARVQAVMAAAM